MTVQNNFLLEQMTGFYAEEHLPLGIKKKAPAMVGN